MSEQQSQNNLSLYPALSEKTSFLLSQITAASEDKTVHLGYLIAQFKGRSFGGLLLILSIFALLPVVSFIAGLLIFFVGVQMLMGLSVPFLPPFIMKQKMDKRNFESFVDKAMPSLIYIEGYIQPRWYFLTHAFSQRLLGGIICLLALISMLPLPFSNIPPSISLVLISLGLLQRDGVLMCMGIFMSLIALTLGYNVLLFFTNAINVML